MPSPSNIADGPYRNEVEMLVTVKFVDAVRHGYNLFGDLRHPHLRVSEAPSAELR